MFGDGKDKPSAAEQMVAKMLGFTPGQMQEVVTGLRDHIVGVHETLQRVEALQQAAIAKLEALENGTRGEHDAG